MIKSTFTRNFLIPLFLITLSLLVPGSLCGQSTPFSWQEFSLGSPSLAFKVPGKPLPQHNRLPDKVATYIRQYDGYYLEDKANGIIITMMHVLYNESITADFRNAAEGTIGQWKATGSVVEIRNSVEQIIAGRQSLVQGGVFNSGGEAKEFSTIVIGDGPKLWQVIVIIRAKDERLRTAMKTIMDSMAFKSK